MKRFEVLISFTDDLDTAAPPGRNVYWRGSRYPREGYTPTDERIKYLQSNKTRYKKPVLGKSGGKKHD